MLAVMATSDAHLIADLRTLLDVSRRLGASTELDPLLEQIMAAATAVLGCERATVFLYDAANHELYSQLATGAEHIRFCADKGIAGEVGKASHAVNDVYLKTNGVEGGIDSYLLSAKLLIVYARKAGGLVYRPQTKEP